MLSQLKLSSDTQNSCNLVVNLGFIKNERQTLAAVIGAIVLGIITILVGVCVLLLPLGITSTLSISLGALGIALGSVVVAYSLRILYVQSNLRRQQFLETKHALNLNHLRLTKNSEPILSLLFPSPIDAFTYSKTHCMGRIATWISLLEIVLGISAIVGSVLSELLLSGWFRPGISLGLAVTGASLLVSGIASIRAFSLNVQGALNLYLAHHIQDLRNKEGKAQETIIESLTSRVNLLESHLNQANLKVASLTSQLTVKQTEISHLKNRFSFMLASKGGPSPLPPPHFSLGSWGSSLKSSSVSLLSRLFSSNAQSASLLRSGSLQLRPLPICDGSASEEEDEWFDAIEG